MKLYISGKISGLDFEEVKAKFTEAEDFLNEIGIEAVNPLKNGLSVDDAWIKHLCKDIEILNDCDSIYMMDGWQESIGACVEYDFAVRTGKKILFESSVMRSQIIILRIENAIHEVTGLRLNQYNTKSRKRDSFFARMLFAHHCRKQKMKLTQIAKHVNRDHSTVLYLLKKYKDEFKYNLQFRVIAIKVEDVLDKKIDGTQI